MPGVDLASGGEVARALTSKEFQAKPFDLFLTPIADKSWKAFRDDPDWKKAKDASEKDGVLVQKVESVFMNPTDYSPIK